MNEKAVQDSAERNKVVTEIDDSYIVEAGAGTGKTSLLLKRVKNIIMSEKAKLNEIVIITFTEKAAAELKIKLRNELETAYRKEGTRKSKIIEHALEDFERGNISTIHSFAASMLRERPVEASVDPQFKVADELTLSLLFDEAWKKWLDMEMEYSASPLKKALRFGVTLGSIKEVAQNILANRELYKGKPSKADASLSSFLKEYEKNAVKLMDLGSKHCTNEEDKGYQQIHQLYHYLQGLKQSKTEDKVLAIIEMHISRRSGNKKNWDPEETCSEVKDIFERFGNEIEDFKKKIAQDICAELADWLGGFLTYFDLEKREKGYLDFEDLLIYARDMLRGERNNKEARRYFQNRYKYIFVDEFQDTDPLQTEIIFFLSEEVPEASRWNNVKVKTGKLFIVGDPKQSIYRFRRADIEIYNQAKNLLLERGKQSNIQVNFRSVPSIITWVNNFFSDLIKREADYDFQPDYIPIEANRKEIQKPGSVIMVTPPEGIIEEKRNINEMRELESRYVASLIRYVVDHKKWKVFNKRDRCLRETRFSDFAILLRKTTGIEHYEYSFRNFDIPYRIVGSKHFYKKQEVISLLSVLKAIDNPSDELSIVCALRSEFFSHSDEEIFLFKESGGDFNYLRNKKLNDKISISLNVLHKLHSERNKRGIPLLLMDLFHQTKVIELNYLKPLGEQRVANLLKILDMARTHERTELSNFKNFTKWLDEMQVEEREVEESPISEEDDDAVRMMTIHKAKGLEFPYVILGMLESSTRKKNKFLVDRLHGRFEFMLGDLEPASFEQLKELEEKREDAEEKRIFYVAATRAREKLVLPIFSKNKAGGIITYLEGRIPENKRDLRGKEEQAIFFFDECSLNLQTKETQPFKTKFQDQYLQNDFSKIIERKENWLSYLSDLKKSAGEGWKLKSATSVKEELLLGKESGTIKKEDRGIEIGKAVHAILSEIDLIKPKDIEKWSQFKVLQSAVPNIAKKVSILVQNAFGMPTLKEAAMNRYFKEVPFSIAVSNTILEGNIDLLYEKDGAFIAADYKTDKVANDLEIGERMKHYKVQAAVYAYALSKILEKNIKEIHFLFLNIQKERVIAIDQKIIDYGKSLVTSCDSPINFET